MGHADSAQAGHAQMCQRRGDGLALGFVEGLQGVIGHPAGIHAAQIDVDAIRVRARHVKTLHSAGLAEQMPRRAGIEAVLAQILGVAEAGGTARPARSDARTRSCGRSSNRSPAPAAASALDTRNARDRSDNHHDRCADPSSRPCSRARAGRQSALITNLPKAMPRSQPLPVPASARVTLPLTSTCAALDLTTPACASAVA